MFTGIVTEVGRVEALGPGTLRILGPATVRGLDLGASVAVNGVCLTATVVEGDAFSTYVMPETFARSALSELRQGSPVNLERPLRFGDEVGGHLVQGHVDGVGEVVSTIDDGNARRVRVKASGDILRYCAEKGSIAIDDTGNSPGLIVPVRSTIADVPAFVVTNTCPPGGFVPAPLVSVPA